MNRDLNIILWNRGRTIGEFGKKEEDVLGKNIGEIIEGERLEAVKKEFIDVMNSGKPISYERESPEPNRKERKIFRVTRTPIFEENNHVIAVLSIGEDITERRLLEQKLIDNDKLAGIGQLAAGVAHEINNPMAAISGCAEALIERFVAEEYRDMPEYEDIVRYLKIIEEEIYRCKKITGNLLTFARMGGKDSAPQKINAIIDDILNLLIYQQSFQSISVVKEYDSNLPNVFANEGDLRQVFLIIILNAMDAMENGGELRIKAYQTDNEVRFEFKDTGCGIPIDYINRIFDPFFTTKQPGKGTGLGLSIAYGIISQLKGRIDVESKEGIGTKFIILCRRQSENFLTTERLYEI